MPLISVIIPTYNRAYCLKRAIDSVINQTFKNYELIIVDDGSTDHTQALLNSYQNQDCFQMKIHHLPKNKGVSAARNVGIMKAQGQWIAFLDSDDEWLPKKLEKQYDDLQHFTDAGVYFTDEIWIRNSKRVNPHLKHQKHEGWIFKKSLSLCLIAPSSALIPKQIFDRVGLFDESLPVCEDYDLWLRIAAHYPVHLLDEKLMRRYGGHVDQLSSRWGHDCHRIRSLCKIFHSVPLSFENQRHLLQNICQRCSILQAGFLKRLKFESAFYYQNLLNHYERLLGLLPKNTYSSN